MNPALYVIGNLLSSSFNNAMTSGYDKKMMDYENKLANENWEKQNEYNDPRNSYARLMLGLKENGLNPYLALGGEGRSGSVMGNASQPAQTPNGSGRKLMPVDFAQSLGLSLEASRVSAQNELSEAQANQANAYADYIKGAKTDNTNADTGYKLGQISYTEVLGKVAYGTLDEIYARIPIYQQQIKESDVRIKLDENKILVGNSQIDLNKAHIKSEEGRQALMNAQTLLAGAQKLLVDAQTLNEGERRNVLIKTAEKLGAEITQLTLNNEITARTKEDAILLVALQRQVLEWQEQMAGVNAKWQVAEKWIDNITKGLNSASEIVTNLLTRGIKNAGGDAPSSDMGSVPLPPFDSTSSY